MKWNIRFMLLVSGLFCLVTQASAFTLIDDYQVYLDNTGPAGANAASDFLSGSGSHLIGIDAFQSNGNSLVIQQATGGGGLVQTGDRFWSIGYLALQTADVAGVTTGLGPLYGGGSNRMYILFQLGGTVDIDADPPVYIHDAGAVSVVLDNDGGLLAMNLDPLMNRPSDGASFEGLANAFIQDVVDGTFVMPGPGSAPINPLTPFLAGADTEVLQLHSLAFIPGLSGGEIPGGFNIPNSQDTGDFGNDSAVTAVCLLGIFYDEFDVDLCTLADSDPDLSRFFWAISGQTTSKDFGQAVINLISEDNVLIAQTLTLGDTADLATQPPVVENPTGCRVTGGRSSSVDWDGTFANGEDRDVYSFGGQAGASTSAQPDPQGQWQHNNHRGPSGSFSFHTSTILKILCSDPGWCNPAREAPFKQLDFEGIGDFRNVKPKGNFEIGVPRYVRVHVEDRGEPGKGHRQPQDLADCPLPLDIQDMDALEAFLLANDQVAVLPFPEALCADCADIYQIEIHETVDPGSPVIYSVGGPIRTGNLQIHPPTGAN